MPTRGFTMMTLRLPRQHRGFSRLLLFLLQLQLPLILFYLDVVLFELGLLVSCPLDFLIVQKLNMG